MPEYEPMCQRCRGRNFHNCNVLQVKSDPKSEANCNNCAAAGKKCTLIRRTRAAAAHRPAPSQTQLPVPQAPHQPVPQVPQQMVPQQAVAYPLAQQWVHQHGNYGYGPGLVMMPTPTVPMMPAAHVGMKRGYGGVSQPQYGEPGYIGNRNSRRTAQRKRQKTFDSNRESEVRERMAVERARQEERARGDERLRNLEQLYRERSQQDDLRWRAHDRPVQHSDERQRMSDRIVEPQRQNSQLQEAIDQRLDINRMMLGGSRTMLNNAITAQESSNSSDAIAAPSVSVDHPRMTAEAWAERRRDAAEVERLNDLFQAQRDTTSF